MPHSTTLTTATTTATATLLDTALTLVTKPHYSTQRYTTLHYATLYYFAVHYTNDKTPQLQLQLHLDSSCS